VSPVPDDRHPRTAAILLGGGSGKRVGAEVNKVLLPLAGRPVFAWSLETIRSLPYVVQVLVVARPGDRGAVEPELAGELLVEGGAERHDSEWNALQVLAPDIEAGNLDVVAIHDAARPLAPRELWDAVVDAAQQTGGALPVHLLSGIIRRDGSLVDETVGVQTPQAFRARELLAAYRAADRDGFKGTDTASCLERYGDLHIAGVEAPATNLKITFPEDVALAERVLQGLREA
jgi:2-C-methyl-D-erythritol 4-phosphate cytidylyltransferase